MINKRVTDKLKYSGYKISPKVFIYMRLIFCLILFCLLLFIDYGYILAPLVSIFYYFGMEYIVLDIAVKKRKILLEKNALSYFPIFMMGLKKYNNIKKSLNTCNEIIDNELALEFRSVINKINFGRSVSEALCEMKSRIPSKYICNIIDCMIKFDNNDIFNIIELQLELIDKKNNYRLINKLCLIPYKIATLSILFFLLVLIILFIFTLFL